jgi:hypothetical protein
MGNEVENKFVMAHNELKDMGHLMPMMKEAY